MIDPSAYHTRNLTIFTASLYQAIKDLTKALEFEPNSADILHERGKLFNPALTINLCFRKLPRF